MVERAPVMVPSPQARRGLGVVRRRRLLAQDGALVLVHEDGRHEVLAAAGDVSAAWWTPVAAAVGVGPTHPTVHTVVTDLVVVERRDAPALLLASRSGCPCRVARPSTSSPAATSWAGRGRRRTPP